jgi:hypothetical protein
VQEQEQQHHQLEIVSCSNQDPAQGLFLWKHAARNNNLVHALGLQNPRVLDIPYLICEKKVLDTLSSIIARLRKLSPHGRKKHQQAIERARTLINAWGEGRRPPPPQGREALQNSVEVELSGNKCASSSVPHVFNIVPNMFPIFTTLIFYTSSFLEHVRARGGVPNVLFQLVLNMFPTFTSFVVLCTRAPNPKFVSLW